MPRAWAAASYANGVDVAMSGVLTFADGNTAGFDCGFTHPLRTWVEIVGWPTLSSFAAAVNPPARATAWKAASER